MPEEQSNAAGSPAGQRRPGGHRRGRRGGRGRRPAPRRTVPTDTAESTGLPPEETGADTRIESAPEKISASIEPAPVENAAADVEKNSPAVESAPAPAPVYRPQREFVRRPEPVRRPPPVITQPAEVSAIAAAAEQVRRIVELLEESLEQMEQVLHAVEQAEREKIADERELDQLRRALRRIQPQRPLPQNYEPHRGQPREDYRPRQPDAPREPRQFQEGSQPAEEIHSAPEPEEDHRDTRHLDE